MPLSREQRVEKYKAYFESPFVPSENVDADNRIASALEYIAYNMGEINRKLDSIGEKLSLVATKM